jgi:hypothetical protein
VLPCIIVYIAFALTCNFLLQNSIVSKHLIYDLYVCTCVFLLRQDSFNMVLVNKPPFYDGGVIVGIRAMLKLSAC